MKERDLITQILLRHGARPDVRLWRNESGMAWVGHDHGRTTGGHMVISHARMIKVGLAPGSADIVGIMAPSGRFIALEVKTAKVKATKGQKAFIDLIKNMGGIAGFVRSVEDVDKLLGAPPDV